MLLATLTEPALGRTLRFLCRQRFSNCKEPSPLRPKLYCFIHLEMFPDYGRAVPYMCEASQPAPSRSWLPLGKQVHAPSSGLGRGPRVIGFRKADAESSVPIAWSIAKRARSACRQSPADVDGWCSPDPPPRTAGTQDEPWRVTFLPLCIGAQAVLAMVGRTCFVTPMLARQATCGRNACLQGSCP